MGCWMERDEKNERERERETERENKKMKGDKDGTWGRDEKGEEVLED